MHVDSIFIRPAENLSEGVGEEVNSPPPGRRQNETFEPDPEEEEEEDSEDEQYWKGAAKIGSGVRQENLGRSDGEEEEEELDDVAHAAQHER